VCTLCDEAPAVGEDVLICDRCYIFVCIACVEGELPEQDTPFYCPECRADRRFVSDSEDGDSEVGALSDDVATSSEDDESEAEFCDNCEKLKKAGDKDGLKEAEKARAKKLKEREKHLFKPGDSDDSDDEAVVASVRDVMRGGKRPLVALVERNAAMLLTDQVERDYRIAELEFLLAEKPPKKPQVSRNDCSDDDDDDATEEEEEGEKGEKVRA